MSIQAMVTGLQIRLQTHDEILRLLTYEKFVSYLETYGSDEEASKLIESFRNLLLDSEMRMDDLQRIMRAGVLNVGRDQEYPIPPLEKTLLTRLIDHLFSKE